MSERGITELREERDMLAWKMSMCGCPNSRPMHEKCVYLRFHERKMCIECWVMAVREEIEQIKQRKKDGRERVSTFW